MTSLDREDLLSSLLERVELKEFLVFELFAKRNEEFEGAPANETVEIKPNYTLKTGILKNLSGIIIRLTVEFEIPMGRVLCDIGATYSSKTPIEFTPENLVLVDFANEVAVMMLVPFLRQNIADLSQRTFGVPLLMPVVRKGMLQFLVDKN